MSKGKTIQVYHIQYEKLGNGPVYDTIEGLLEDIRDRLDDEPQNFSVTAEVWARKRYDELPEFEGY